MHKVEPVKRLLENATGIGVPTRDEALACVRCIKPRRMKFRDDGYIPNNPKLALLYYRAVIRLDRKHDPAATLEVIFEANSWGKAWRNGIYDFVHYHSMVHEVLGVARGSATLRLGGNKGRTVKVSAGDVIVIPAGVGHECLNADTSFLVVGAYPPAALIMSAGAVFRNAIRRSRPSDASRFQSGVRSLARSDPFGNNPPFAESKNKAVCGSKCTVRNLILVYRPGRSRTLITPSFLSRNFLYISGASSKRAG